jgi:hypothetical protein
MISQIALVEIKSKPAEAFSKDFWKRFSKRMEAKSKYIP